VWEGNPHVVNDDHLFLLQFHTGSWWGEMVLSSVQRGIGRLFTGYGSRMSQGLTLSDALVFHFLGEERKGKLKKEREREAAKAFFPGLEAEHALLAVPGGISAAVRCI
jgi:hypothetical protein